MPLSITFLIFVQSSGGLREHRHVQYFINLITHPYNFIYPNALLGALFLYRWHNKYDSFPVSLFCSTIILLMYLLTHWLDIFLKPWLTMPVDGICFFLLDRVWIWLILHHQFNDNVRQLRISPRLLIINLFILFRVTYIFTILYFFVIFLSGINQENIIFASFSSHHNHCSTWCI